MHTSWKPTAPRAYLVLLLLLLLATCDALTSLGVFPRSIQRRVTASSTGQLTYPLPRWGVVANSVNPKLDLLSLCEATPKNGVDAPDDTKRRIEDTISRLAEVCPPRPALINLRGCTYKLLYSTAPGGSNGKVGPFVGTVTQRFSAENDVDFVNSVELFGVLRISLHAERTILDDTRIRVTFKQTRVSMFDIEVFRKNISGSGVWKQLYVDSDLRVMNTPSIFVLKKQI
jgi:hypothetical protein